MTVRRPDFFIVGAPKSGTTSLHAYLNEHPDVFLPARKEPHYFCPDLYSPRYVHDETTYLSLFRPGAEAQRAGEASVYYLYSREAAARIKAFNPDARIIIMLRRPTDMIYSLHSQRLYSGHEDLEDFAAALAAEPERRRGRRLPPNPYPIECLFYREIGRYAEQVRRYLETFDRSRVHVIIFDEFAADTAGAYAATCRFLGLDPSPRARFTVHKENKQIRSPFVRNVMKFSPGVRTIVRTLAPPSLRRRLGQAVIRLNSRSVARPVLAADLRRTLDAEFAPDVERLAALLGRDLSLWTLEPGTREHGNAETRTGSRRVT
ncbi:MAG TPA: sulfotransferase [bacterium]|jgi:hypothetical protein|nr:sulfotransferase [bacterium]